MSPLFVVTESGGHYVVDGPVDEVLVEATKQGGRFVKTVEAESAQKAEEIAGCPACEAAKRPLRER